MPSDEFRVELQQERPTGGPGYPLPDELLFSPVPLQEADQEELHATLVDLAKAGAKEDFYFLARSSGLQDVTDLDLLWSGTRRRLQLPNEVAQ